MKVVEKVLQKKIHKVGWCCVRFCRFLKFHNVLSGSVKFSEVQKITQSRTVFSPREKSMRRSCKVLQGSEVPFGSIRLDNDPQDSTKFEMDLLGSSRFCEALRYSTRSTRFNGPSRF